MQQWHLQLADGCGDERREHDIDARRHRCARLAVQQRTVRQVRRHLQRNFLIDVPMIAQMCGRRKYTSNLQAHRWSSQGLYALLEPCYDERSDPTRLLEQAVSRPMQGPTSPSEYDTRPTMKLSPLPVELAADTCTWLRCSCMGTAQLQHPEEQECLTETTGWQGTGIPMAWHAVALFARRLSPVLVTGLCILTLLSRKKKCERALAPPRSRTSVYS